MICPRRMKQPHGKLEVDNVGGWPALRWRRGIDHNVPEFTSALIVAESDDATRGGGEKTPAHAGPLEGFNPTSVPDICPTAPQRPSQQSVIFGPRRLHYIWEAVLANAEPAFSQSTMAMSHLTLIP